MVNILSRRGLLSFLIINILTIDYVKCAINWNGNNWAMQCDFAGNDLSNVKIPPELCGGKCAETAQCTHFTWTNFEGGTCWMKKGAVSKSNAFSTIDPTVVCGVVRKSSGSIDAIITIDSIGGNTDGDGDIINEQTFACVFNTIHAGTRANRFNGLRESGWKPSNKDEAAVFLAHVFHETDGLKTIREYCAPGLSKNL